MVIFWSVKISTLRTLALSIMSQSILKEVEFLQSRYVIRYVINIVRSIYHTIGKIELVMLHSTHISTDGPGTKLCHNRGPLRSRYDNKVKTIELEPIQSTAEKCLMQLNDVPPICNDKIRIYSIITQ